MSFFPPQEEFPSVDPELEAGEANKATPTHQDEFLTVDVMLPFGGATQQAKVVNRKLNQDGTPVGKRHSNPMLDSREYEVLFPDGSTDFVTANTIAENLYSQVDNQGNTFLILSEIIDHKSDATALTKVNGFSMSSNGRKYPKRSTREWKLLVSWKIGFHMDIS